MSLRQATVFTIALLTSSLLFGQRPVPGTTAMDGTTPPGIAVGAPSGSYPLSGFEHVNLFNGTLDFHLPLATISGRGEAQYTMTLAIERRWLVEEICTGPDGSCSSSFSAVFSNQDSKHPIWGTLFVGYSPGIMQSRETNDPVQNNCTAPGVNITTAIKTLSKLTFTSPDGTEYELVDEATGGKVFNVDTCTGSIPSRGNVFVSRDGSGLRFVLTQPFTDAVAGDPDGGIKRFNMNGVLYFPSGTRYLLQAGQVMQIEDRNGNFLTFGYDSAGEVQTITDSIGRVTTITYASAVPGCDQINIPGAGTASRTVQVCLDSLGNVLPSPLTTRTYSQLFGGGISSSFQFNPTIVKNVILPETSQQYTFGYNTYGELTQVTLPTGGGYSYQWDAGDPSQNTYQDSNGHPSGIISVNQVLGCCTPSSNPLVYRRVTQRKVLQNVTSATVDSTQVYTVTTGTTTFSGQSKDNQTVDVITTGAQGNFLSRSKHYFYGRGNDPNAYGPVLFSYQFWVDGREYQTDELNSAAQNATVLQSTVETWQQRTCQTDEHCLTAANNSAPTDNIKVQGAENSPVDPRISGSQVTLDTAQTSSQSFGYDRYNNQTSVIEYNYGGAMLRTTATQYLTVNPVNNLDYTAPPIFLRNLPSQITVSGPAGEQSQTAFEYDKYTSDASHAPLVSRSGATQLDASVGTSPRNDSRGNVTMATRANIGGPNAVTVQQYDTAGNVVLTKDANGNSTMIDFAANGNSTVGKSSTNPNSYAFPTTITDALGFKRLLDWDTNIGKPTLIRQQLTRAPTYSDTTYDYSDPLDRLKQVTRQDGGTTTHTYIDTSNQVTKTTAVAADAACAQTLSIVADQIYDGLGRKSREIRHDPAGLVYIDTLYDGGRVSKVSNPYFSTGSPQYITTTYDPLGRVSSVTTQDGSAATTTYSGNQATTKDPQCGTNTQCAGYVSTHDARGRLIFVTEPDAGTPGGIHTKYTYNAFDDLKSVAQNVDASGNCTNCLSRTFTYDSFKHLLTAVNPESGTITYTYDANGNVHTRTAPLMNVNDLTKTVTTTYQYDALNRMTAKTYSDTTNSTPPTTSPDPTPTVSYTYDDPNVPNSIRHLTSVTSTDSSITPNKTYITNYTNFDVMGHVTASSQKTNGTTYSFIYNFNQAGALDSITYPSQRQVITCYDTAGRANKLDGVLSGTTTHYVTSAGYAAHGAIGALALGNHLTETTAYSLDRLQPTQITVGSLLTLESRYCGPGLASCNNNNGSLQSQKITRGSNIWTQTYGYDFLDRLTSASETGPGNPWSESYGYDVYGNRWVPSTTAQSLNNETPKSQDWYTASNQITGWVYDGAGNLLSIPSMRAATYDAESRQISGMMNGVTTTYVYDGDGRRVQKISPSGTTTFVYDAQAQLAQEYSTASTDSGTSYLTADFLGSTRLLTDSNGALKKPFDYFPFGQELQAGTTGRTTAMGYNDGISVSLPDILSGKFTGKERDAETGLDYFGARYMSGAQGRFTSPDPDNYGARIDQPQAWNMYAYTWNNPMKYADDDGRVVNFVLGGIGAGVGFVSGFGGNAISQYVQNGSVNWGKAAAYGAGGAVTGSLAGLSFGGSLLAEALAGAAVGTIGGVGGGLISRGFAGEEIFDPDAMESDLETGAIGGAIGAGIQFVGTVIKLPAIPKPPNPLASVRTQLKRMAQNAAWQLTRRRLNNQFAAIGGATGAVYANVGLQVKRSYDIRQSLVAFGFLDQTVSTQKNKKAVKGCVTTDAVGGGKEKVCE